MVAVTTGVPSPAWMRQESAAHRMRAARARPAPRRRRPRRASGRASSRWSPIRARAARRWSRFLAVSPGGRVGIVLSGGGARALAHLGVLEELDAAGIRFDRIAGVSLGSLVAASAAAGFTHEERYECVPGCIRRQQPHERLRPAGVFLDPRPQGAPADRRGVRRAPDRGAPATLLQPERRPDLPRDRPSPDRPDHRRRLPEHGDPRRVPARRRPRTGGCSSTAACSTTSRSRRCPGPARAR